MNDEGKTARLWDDVWASGASPEAGILKDRFTVEAYKAFRPFVSSEDRLILEAGCGTGRFCNLMARDFPGSEVTGIDLAPHGLEMARNISLSLGCTNAAFETASLFAMPFPDNRFDLVFNEGVVQLFGTEGKSTCKDAVWEMRRVAKPGGKVMVSVVNWACLPHTWYKWQLEKSGRRYEYDYEKSYRRSELHRLFGECGLKDVRFSGYYPSYGYYRLASRVRRGAPLLRLLGKLADRLDGPWFSRKFGFEIVAVGRK